MKIRTKEVTFVIPSYNTLSHTMMSYWQVRSRLPKNEIIIVDNGSNDGTEDWLFGSITENKSKISGQLDLDDNLRGWRNSSDKKFEISSLYDIGIKMAKSEFILLFQYKKDIPENYFDNIVSACNDPDSEIINKSEYLKVGPKLIENFYGKNNILHTK